MSRNRAPSLRGPDVVCPRYPREPLPGSVRKGRHGFYSQTHNAHFFFDAGDSRTTPGDIWVWRYRRGSQRPATASMN